MTRANSYNRQDERAGLKHFLVVGLLLLLFTVIVYEKVFDSDFVNYDDVQYILDNHVVRGGLTVEGMLWSLTATQEENWFPLTWMSHMLDVSLFGLDARGHHAVNLLLHVVNTLLLLAALSRMTGSLWRSAVVAALFALHPLHVESVAWIAERKDLLSGLFFMLTLLAYHAYVTRPSPVRYLAVLIAFTLGLCSKPMLVTLPFLLLLLDVWPLNRTIFSVSNNKEVPDPIPVLTLVIEKIPLICLSVASSILTFIVQTQGGAVVDYANSSLIENSANALISYVRYIYLSVFPRDLAVIYPFPQVIPYGHALLAAILLSLVTFLTIRARHQRPYFAVGWFWFLGTLVPVIGIVRVGAQAMADRYTYLSIIGLFIMAVWGMAEAAAVRKTDRRVLAGGTTVLLVMLAAQTWVQAGYWHDTMTLFNRALSVTEENWVAYEKLGSGYADQGNREQALAYLRESIRINPLNAIAYNNLGSVYTTLGDYEQAIVCYRRAIELNPRNAVARFNYGLSLLSVRGDVFGAMHELAALMDLDAVKANFLQQAIVQHEQMRRTNSR